VSKSKDYLLIYITEIGVIFCSAGTSVACQTKHRDEKLTTYQEDCSFSEES
jgi:hypothetical protein